METVILENDILSVKLLPGMGGKIISFYRKDNGFELAACTEREYCEIPQESEGFSHYAFGMDEAFPNINAESITWKGRWLYYPDHGEIWNHAFRVLEQEPLSVRLVWLSKRFFYHYEKKLSLEGEKLCIQYRIANIGKEELPCIWTWHGLMRYEQDMEILMPEGISYCRNVLEGSCLGEEGRIYPIRNSAYDFVKMPSAETQSMVKYYGEERVNKGYCGFLYPTQKVCCILQYDAQALPYLGIWITAGKFQGDYNCALEPSSGFYDSISKARELGKLQILSSGETLEFELSITLGKIGATEG